MPRPRNVLIAGVAVLVSVGLAIAIPWYCLFRPLEFSREGWRDESRFKGVRYRMAPAVVVRLNANEWDLQRMLLELGLPDEPKPPPADWNGVTLSYRLGRKPGYPFGYWLCVRFEAGVCLQARVAAD